MFDELERALPDEGWAELRYHDRQSRGLLESITTAHLELLLDFLG